MQFLRYVGVIGLWVLLAGLSPALGKDLSARTDPAVRVALQQYLHAVGKNGGVRSQQGVWLQSAQAVLGQHQGQVPMSAASLTKIATTLAALQTWGARYQFVTRIETTGATRQGVLRGDVIVRGGADPFFVWEDAIALGNTLHHLGLRHVTGRLVIVGDFYMNFVTDPIRAGELLKHGMNATLWSQNAEKQYGTMPPETPRPQLFINGPVVTAAALPAPRRPLVRHRSLPLLHILKKMNVHSNNTMAKMLTTSLGGPAKMARQAAHAAGAPARKMQLINGSGLGRDNRMSARTVCALLVAIQGLLHPDKLSIADVFPVVGQDRGTIRRRDLPFDAIVKTGSLRQVSSLAGVILTHKHGPVWFTLLNQGKHIARFRAQQDIFLQTLMASWGTIASPPPAFAPNTSWENGTRDDILVKHKTP